jgi:hypothetical protein
MLSRANTAEGWLQKADSLKNSTVRKALGLQTWKKRYFVLRAGEINYFERKPATADENHPRRAWLKVIRIKWWEFDGGPALEIVCVKGKSFFCAASTAEDAQRWIDACSGQSNEFARYGEEGKVLSISDIETLWTVDKRLAVEVRSTTTCILVTINGCIVCSVSCAMNDLASPWVGKCADHVLASFAADVRGTHQINFRRLTAANWNEAECATGVIFNHQQHAGSNWTRPQIQNLRAVIAAT